MNNNHPIIWLAPQCQTCESADRLWCKDNVWGHGCEECGAMPVKYVLADNQPIKKEGELL
jgi:translation initiation factor 2 beta subunit (eIF-2beta)/eIF-5